MPFNYLVGQPAGEPYTLSFASAGNDLYLGGQRFVGVTAASAQLFYGGPAFLSDTDSGVRTFDGADAQVFYAERFQFGNPFSTSDSIYFPTTVSAAINGNAILNDRGTFTNVTGRIIVTYDGMVPEPATWAMMIAGFGLVGARIRRSRSLTRHAAA